MPPTRKKLDARAANMEKMNSAIAVIGETFGQTYLTAVAHFRRTDAVHDSCTGKFDGRIPSNADLLLAEAKWDLLLSVGLSDVAMGEIDRCSDLFEAALAGSKEAKHALLVSLGKVVDSSTHFPPLLPSSLVFPCATSVEVVQQRRPRPLARAARLARSRVLPRCAPPPSSPTST